MPGTSPWHDDIGARDQILRVRSFFVTDDIVASFTIDGAPARGRYVRLGDGTIDAILHRHDYPRPVALLLGEALTLAPLIGSLFKVEGRLVIQAEGNGPVNLLVAEYQSGGGLRGYARIAEGAAEALKNEGAMAPQALLGAGALALSLDQGPDMRPVQGVVPLTGATLAACAEDYFSRSEQTPTHIKLAVAEHYSRGTRAGYRSGGALLQRVAGDDARGDTEEAWSRATIFFETLTVDELVDPQLPAGRILYRLFHEDGVRMAEPAPLTERCTCDRERLTALVRTFNEDDVKAMVEPDGLIHAHCQFCSRLYLIAPQDLAAG
jgi:molecular chaperone Hsp33